MPIKPCNREPPNGDGVIVIAIYSFSFGGSERIAAELAMRYRKSGRKVVVIALSNAEGPIKEMLESENIDCRGFGQYLIRGRRNLLFDFMVARYLEQYEIYGMHVHHIWTYGRVLPQIGRRSLNRVIVTEHGISPFQQIPLLKSHAKKWLRKKPLLTVLNVEMANYFIEKLECDDKKINVVRNGIDVSTIPCRDSRYVGDNGSSAFRLVWAGRMHTDKGLDILFRSLEIIKREQRLPVELHLLGDGELRADLVSLATKLGIVDELRWHGFVDDVCDHFLQSDCFVMPSRTEAMPMAMLEAMATGLPCIGTKVGSIPELLDSGAGIVVDVGDDVAIADAILEIARNPKRAANMGMIGRNWVERNHDLEKIACQYLELLDSG